MSEYAHSALRAARFRVRWMARARTAKSCRQEYADLARMNNHRVVEHLNCIRRIGRG